MSRRSLKLLPALLLLAYAQCVSGDSGPSAHAVTNVSDKGLDQIVYKGLVGNVLDEIPMDPSKRVSLQRTNAIVSNTLSGHTLTTLVGLSNPVLLIGGLVWGVWSASNIRAEDEHVGAATRGPAVALLAAGIPVARHLSVVSPGEAQPGAPEEPAPTHPPVVKIWLPQRAPSSGSTQ